MKTPSKASANWYRGFARAGNLIKDEMANAKHKIIANGDETLWQHIHECLSLDKNMTPTTKPKGIRIQYEGHSLIIFARGLGPIFHVR